MDTTYQRVAASSLGWWCPVALIALMFLLYMLALKLGRVTPWPLIALCAAITILGLSDIPREVWMKRELTLIAGICAAATIYHLQEGKRSRKLFEAATGCGALIFLGILAFDPSNETGVQILTIGPKRLEWRAQDQAIVSSSIVARLDASAGLLRLESSGAKTELNLSDYFWDQNHHYVAGNELAKRISDWAAHYPEQRVN